MGLFNRFRKKQVAELPDMEGMKEYEEVKPNSKPLKMHEIKEIDFGEAVPEETDTGGIFGVLEPSFKPESSMAEPSDSVSISLEHAMMLARKYLIVHAQVPDKMMPKKSMKKDTGGFYFEFKDRELHRITLDARGEVTEWERE